MGKLSAMNAVLIGFVSSFLPFLLFFSERCFALFSLFFLLRFVVVFLAQSDVASSESSEEVSSVQGVQASAAGSAR